MVESDLHFRILKDRLITEAHKYLDLAKTELEYGWHIDIPQPSGTLGPCFCRRSAASLIGS